MVTIDFTVGGFHHRRELRDIVLHKFMEEEPGQGGGTLASKYRYDVETLSDGRKIYLTRPAYLKKGFDFRINVEGMTFQTGGEYPKHGDILDDLSNKKRENAGLAIILRDAIQKVHDCEDPQEILAGCKDLLFQTGYTIEMLLKVIRWFLIEQDIRDWNYSGRAMFMKGVNDALQ
jgi:hypothetical protein